MGGKDKAVGALPVGKLNRAPGRVAAMDRELDQDDMADIQADLDALIRMGLVTVDGNGGLVLTEAGEDAIHKCNAQT